MDQVGPLQTLFVEREVLESLAIEIMKHKMENKKNVNVTFNVISITYGDQREKKGQKHSFSNSFRMNASTKQKLGYFT